MDVKIILKNSFTTKVTKHIPTGLSMSTVSLFKSIENKHDVYSGKDCLKKSVVNL